MVERTQALRSKHYALFPFACTGDAPSGANISLLELQADQSLAISVIILLGVVVPQGGERVDESMASSVGLAGCFRKKLLEQCSKIPGQRGVNTVIAPAKPVQQPDLGSAVKKVDKRLPRHPVHLFETPFGLLLT